MYVSHSHVFVTALARDHHCTVPPHVYPLVVIINMHRVYFDTNGACVKSGIYVYTCHIYIHVVVYVYMYTCRGIYIHVLVYMLGAKYGLTQPMDWAAQTMDPYFARQSMDFVRNPWISCI